MSRKSCGIPVTKVVWYLENVCVCSSNRAWKSPVSPPHYHACFSQFKLEAPTLSGCLAVDFKPNHCSYCDSRSVHLMVSTPPGRTCKSQQQSRHDLQISQNKKYTHIRLQQVNLKIHVHQQIMTLLTRQKQPCFGVMREDVHSYSAHSAGTNWPCYYENGKFH